jgi:hypothetical protein
MILVYYIAMGVPVVVSKLFNDFNALQRHGSCKGSKFWTASAIELKLLNNFNVLRLVWNPALRPEF